MGNKVFSSRRLPSPSNSGDLAAGMDRWTGVIHVALSRGGPSFRIAASLILSATNKLAVPRANAILFTGDRVRGTGDPTIERLSDAAYLARVLAGKLSGDTNAWVIDAARFAGPFAVYRELVPSVDAAGDPKGYDPTGFPAAAGIASILTHSIAEIQNKISGRSSEDSSDNQHPTESWSSSRPPTTIILGFRPSQSHLNNDLVPTSTTNVLSSISEYHYVDVGLNCAGAYITDGEIIKEIANHVLRTTSNLRFVLHGTPRQWSDPNRLWIRKEKDLMLQLLRDEAQRCEGRLVPSEKIYFDGRPRNLRMHFEILEAMNIH
ncbi:hypothetical protein QOZ80_2BG0195200 [Eleusine coracana subsp. coracana]|nr:hypothetical protein QOZ80_2BG0195200 [Eleusine coracana subsp. coracana]